MAEKGKISGCSPAMSKESKLSKKGFWYRIKIFLELNFSKGSMNSKHCKPFKRFSKKIDTIPNRSFFRDCCRTIEMLFLKQSLIAPFLCHKSATKCQTDSNEVSNSKSKPDLCNYVKTNKVESTAPPQQPHKRSRMFLGDPVVHSSFAVATQMGPAWFPASTRPRSFEGTGRQGSDLLTPGQKQAKISQISQSLFGKPVKRSLHAVELKELYLLSILQKKNDTQTG